MLPAVILLLSIIVFRIAPWWGGEALLAQISGFSPLMAFALCSGTFFSKRWGVALPLVAVIIPSVIMNMRAGFPILAAEIIVVAVFVVAVAGIGGAVVKKKSASPVVVVTASLISTVLFHFVSNTVSFFTDPGYTKTLAGWWQCQTVGLPQYSPQTWVFTARAVVGDMVFSLLFVAAFRARLSHREPTAATGAAMLA